MHISKIYLATHKKDLRLTRICVASIRFWYPDIPILLIKDEYGGSFSTREIEDVWNVQVFDTGHRHFGWGFSKLEPLFIAEKQRFMVVDSDVVFAGKVLDYLSPFDEDFIVQRETQSETDVARLYFSLDELQRWDSTFCYPGYTFNSGQFVATSGVLQREDFDEVIEWTSGVPSLKQPRVFRNEQGVLNYVLMQKAALQKLSIGRVPLMRWPQDDRNELHLADIATGDGCPFVIHWAGSKEPRLQNMICSDILFFFEHNYYSKVRFGKILRWLRPSYDAFCEVRTKVLRKLRRRKITK